MDVPFLRLASIRFSFYNAMSMDNKILLVDDEPRNIFALSAVLKAKGYTVLTAGSMSDVFDRLDPREVGIILLDMMMPDMDGYTALPLLKKDDRWRSIPVVAVTAQAMTGDREKCLAAGADDYLSKPVDVEKLLALLAKYAT